MISTYKESHLGVRARGAVGPNEAPRRGDLRILRAFVEDDGFVKKCVTFLQLSTRNGYEQTHHPNRMSSIGSCRM